MRVSNAISRSLVVSFFTQRHPEVKSSTTERKDGLIEGRKSTNRWDFEELTDAIFSVELHDRFRLSVTKVSGTLPE